MSFPYNTIEKENIVCTMCGENKTHTLSKQGTDGLALTSVICKNCSLIYINPRMTKDGYKRYYEEEYREKTINHGDRGSDFDCKKLFQSTIVHGKALATLVKPYLNVDGALMEVGSGVGGVLSGIKAELHREVVGIEPSSKEADYANSQGIKTYHALIEDHKETDTYAAIITTQSLNHFLDPRYFFEWSYKSLVKDGLLVVEVMNFRQQLRLAGKYSNSVKIDHVYMFTPTALKNLVRSAGFDILHFETDEFSLERAGQGIPHLHIRIVARKTDRLPFSTLYTSHLNYFITLISINKVFIYLQYIFMTRLPQIFSRR